MNVNLARTVRYMVPFPRHERIVPYKVVLVGFLSVVSNSLLVGLPLYGCIGHPDISEVDFRCANSKEKARDICSRC